MFSIVNGRHAPYTKIIQLEKDKYLELSSVGGLDSSVGRVGTKYVFNLLIAGSIPAPAISLFHELLNIFLK